MGLSPSIGGKEEVILMAETSVLIEPSFKDGMAMIAASGDLSEQLKRHWTTSLRQLPRRWTAR